MPKPTRLPSVEELLNTPHEFLDGTSEKKKEEKPADKPKKKKPQKFVPQSEITNEEWLPAEVPVQVLEVEEIRGMAGATVRDTPEISEYLQGDALGEFEFTVEALKSPELRAKYAKMRIPTASGGWIDDVTGEPSPPKHSDWDLREALKWDVHHPNPVYFGFNSAVFGYNGRNEEASEEKDAHVMRTSLYFGGSRNVSEQQLIFGGDQGYEKLSEHAKVFQKTFTPIWNERKNSPIHFPMTDDSDKFKKNSYFPAKPYKFRWHEEEEQWTAKRRNLVEDTAVDVILTETIKDLAAERAGKVPSGKNRYKGIYMHGGAGGGKTTFGKQIAAYLGLPFFAYTAPTQEPITEDGFFYTQRIEDGETVADLADPAYLYSYGGVLQIDEVLLSDLSSNVLLQILSSGETTYTFTSCRDIKYANKTLLRHPAFFVIMTGNADGDVKSHRAEVDIPTNIAARVLFIPPTGEAFDVISMSIAPFFAMSKSEKKIYAKNNNMPDYMSDPFVNKLFSLINTIREDEHNGRPIWESYLETIPSARLMARALNSKSWDEFLSHFEMQQSLSDIDNQAFENLLLSKAGEVWQVNSSVRVKQIFEQEFSAFRKQYKPDIWDDIAANDYLPVSVGSSY